MSSKEVLGWRCWYDDGKVYDSVKYDWKDLPDDGVLVKIIYYQDGTKQIQQGMDYYYEAPHCCGEVIRGTAMPRDDVFGRYDGAVVKRGRWTPDEFYQQVVDMALASQWDA
jgi:hypothetical protein